MHPDLIKLIEIAQESGELTDKQKEIILRKAEKLGEDIDEVEMRLETIKPDARQKDPISVLKGQAAKDEAKAMIEELNKRLKEAGTPKSTVETVLFRGAQAERQIAVIRAFTLPATKEGLSLFLEYAYTNYSSIGNSMSDNPLVPLKKTWYGKTMQAFTSLEKIGEGDPEVKSILSEYDALIKKEKRKLGAKAKTWLFVIADLLFIAGLCYGIFYLIGADSRRRERVEVCIQNHDYKGARIEAQKCSGGVEELMDNISSQEVTYLITKGDFSQARVVAAGINDKEKRDAVSAAIDGSEIKNIPEVEVPITSETQAEEVIEEVAAEEKEKEME